jgi:hypothetical protein
VTQQQLDKAAISRSKQRLTENRAMAPTSEQGDGAACRSHLAAQEAGPSATAQFTMCSSLPLPSQIHKELWGTADTIPTPRGDRQGMVKKGLIQVAGGSGDGQAGLGSP